MFLYGKAHISKAVMIAILLLTALLPVQAQRIFYSEIEKDDYRQMNFEIIGRVAGNINIYKNFRSRHDISVYDNEMKLKNKFKLEFLPDRVINVDFVVYPDSYWMIYQHQKKGIIYCSAAKLNGEGKLMEEPIDLDTTWIPGASDNKIYSMIHSDDKKQIMVFKINRKQAKHFAVTMIRFNPDMQLQERNMAWLDMPAEGVFTEFVLDNDGDLAFGRAARTGSREYVTKLDLVVKPANEDKIIIQNVPLTDRSLDEVKIKPDNLNKRFILNSFFYKQRKGNIEGIYNMVWDKSQRVISSTTAFIFGDTLRMDAKADNIPLKQAFNDYFIKHVIPKRDGGFVLLAELYYTTSRGGAWNRWDYIYGFNSFTPMDLWYYSPYSSLNYWRWMDPTSRFGMSNMTRHFAENIVVLSFDGKANLQWSNVVRKSQFDDNTDMFLSYQIFNTGSELKFLFNSLEKRQLILSSVNINPEGQIKREPTMRNLDQNYDFMPRYGKQVGARQVVIPCINRNFICFAKIDF